MNTQQLESFLAVAENLNFARAAESLNITQSAVSRQIHALESELDTKLFNRTSRIVTLTPSGAAFYEDARNFMRDLHIATSRIKYSCKSNLQPLSLGFSSDINCSLSSDLLQICRREIPEMHPVLRTIPHRAILSLFFQGEIDVLFGFQNDVPSRAEISYVELTRTPICCAVSRSHKYAGKSEIHESELYAEQMIICNSYSLSSQVGELQNRLKQHFLLPSTYYCDNPTVLLTLIRAGYGFGLLPKMNITGDDICAIPFAPEHIVSFGLFYKNNVQNPTLKNFVSTIRKLVSGPNDQLPITD